jgi:hypothetical protein
MNVLMILQPGGGAQQDIEILLLPHIARVQYSKRASRHESAAELILLVFDWRQLGSAYRERDDLYLVGTGTSTDNTLAHPFSKCVYLVGEGISRAREHPRNRNNPSVGQHAKFYSSIRHYIVDDEDTLDPEDLSQHTGRERITQRRTYDVRSQRAP